MFTVAKLKISHTHTHTHNSDTIFLSQLVAQGDKNNHNAIFRATF